MSKRYLKPTIFTMLILIRCMVAQANNIAILSGNWETPANWSTGAVPLATDAVVIPAGITMTVAAAGDVCASLSIINLGTLTISANQSLSIGGNFTNAGTFNSIAGSTVTFNGAANSIISGGGSYTIAGTIVMNMGSTATTLDVQDANFITGINSGAKYYFTFTKGTWIEDNAASLADSYNSGSSTTLTIPYGVVIQSNAGTMNLARKATSGKMLLSGELFLNGGQVNVQTGQALNAGFDFKYSVNGGTPQLYISSGTLFVGAGFNPNANSDYIDFHMTGGTMIVAENGYSNSYTFLLGNNVGGKTFMTGGTIILQDACNAAVEDLDMGGANVAATQYSVTGGTVQIGYSATQAGSTFFGIQAEPATNYPNILFQSGVAKRVGANNPGQQINMLSLYINSNMTFDATGFSTVNILSNNGVFAFDDEGTYTTGNSTMEFSGPVNQLITSSTLATVTFHNLQIANTSGNVTLGVNSTVANQLSFTSGLLDASKKILTLSNGSVATTGASATKYVIVGNGFNTLGNMVINNLPTASSTPFPIGTASYYLPASIQPASAGTSFSAYVFTGATTNGLANGPSFSAPLLANMFNTIWNISQTAGAGSATLNLGWAASGVGLEGSTFASAGTSIGIIQNTGGTAWNTPAGSGSVPGMFATASFSSFTKFAITDLMFVLPVVVSNFNAVAQNNNAALISWSASDVADISRFEVQRSTDGSNFTTIGTVDAAANETSYSLTDTRPASGVNYYRLLIENTDGAQMFSAIRTVDFSSDAAIRIFPVPASTTVNVSLGNAGSGISVRLISVTGQLLQAATVTGNHQVVSMNISNYPAGAYFVQVIGENRILQTTTVTKL